jgi:hypothetical protein
VFALVRAAEAEGFEPPVGCPTLAFNVRDALSDLFSAVVGGGDPPV